MLSVKRASWGEAALLLLTACAVSERVAGPSPEPASKPAPASRTVVEVMVLGTFHMDNPGMDVVNTKIDDVTTPRRQRELERLADQLARFRPTKIAVEQQARGPSFAVASYHSFSLNRLKIDRNEVAQIGFRLAYELGHRTVYGFDELPGRGEPDYYPFEKVQAYARVHGSAAWLEVFVAHVQAEIAALERDHEKRTIGELLWLLNDPDKLTALHRANYELLKLGDGDDQPGADLNAMWYLRNAKMFAKLTNIVRPGDRVLVIVGAGHVYWQRHFIESIPGFGFVDPRPYLEASVL